MLLKAKQECADYNNEVGAKSKKLIKPDNSAIRIQLILDPFFKICAITGFVKERVQYIFIFFRFKKDIELFL